MAETKHNLTKGVNIAQAGQQLLDALKVKEMTSIIGGEKALL
jgi:hypothetical protein